MQKVERDFVDRQVEAFSAHRPYDVIVAGAGFAGAVFARVLAEADRRVLVLEKRATIGGNMYDEYRREVLVHRYGPHIFHTGRREVFDFLNRFASWYEYEHRVVGKIEGKFVPIPFNFTSVERLFDEVTANRFKTKLLAAFGAEAKVPIFDLLNHGDDCVREFGRFVFDRVFAGYTAKQWGVSVDRIDTSTINRVPVVIGYEDRYFADPIQMMPREGYTRLFDELLSHGNITVVRNMDAKEKVRLCFESRRVFFEEEAFDGVFFFTGAVDELLDYRFGRLPYRSLRLVFEEMEVEEFQCAAVVNYPNEEDWTRITEFKHFTAPEKSGSRFTVLLKEYPLAFRPDREAERFYPIINGENCAVYERYARCLLGFDRVYLCGRLAEYRYYNMDAVVARALEVAAQVIAE
jgi:UDP-galactopyranose mutase